MANSSGKNAKPSWTLVIILLLLAAVGVEGYLLWDQKTVLSSDFEKLLGPLPAGVASGEELGRFLKGHFTEEPPLFGEMLRLQQRVNQLFSDSVFRTSASPLFSAVRRSLVFEPDIDIRETPGSLIVQCDIPGMEKDQIEVFVKSNSLVIRGKREYIEEAEGKGFFRRERRLGAFERSLALPVLVSEDGARADYKNGVLTVTLTKAAAPAKESQTKIAVS